MEKRSRVLDYLTFGFVLILTELAAFSHLRFSIEYNCINGRDWPIHVINAFKIFHCHFNFGRVLLWYKSTASTILHYPPFHYLVSAAFWEFLKQPPLIALYASKVFWIALGALAMHFAGRALGNSGYSGVVATVVGILNGFMLSEAQEVSLEYVVPASFALVIYGYTLSQGYQRLAGSFALGVTLGIGLLSKSVLFTFAAPFLILGFFFPPFKVETPFVKRFVYAAFAASVAFGIAALFYLNFFKPFLREAGSESNLSFVKNNLANTFKYYIPSVTTRFTLVLAILAVALQAIKKDTFLIPTLCTIAISIPYMATLQTLGSSYFLPFIIILALIIARGLQYLNSIIRFVITLLVVFVFSIPMLTGKSYIKSGSLSRFFYPDDKWIYGTTFLEHKCASDNDWGTIERFALTFKNRYPNFGYEQIGYVLTDGMVNVPNVAFALAWKRDAWLRDIRWWEDVVKINLHPMPYDEDPLERIRTRELIVFSLPDETPNERYKRLREIYDMLKDERTVDFSFPMYWDYNLPGNYKILMLTKRN